jgi:putative DNA primase/helicase
VSLQNKRTLLQKVTGYALTGVTSEQALFLLYGTGANGKSTFLEVVRALSGVYARQAEFATFLARTSDTVRNDLARLAGARFVTAVEAASGRRLDEALVKQLTGGDPITARFLFQEFFEFTPQFKLFLATNHKPVIRGTEHAIWRRIHLIPFEVTISLEQQDRTLPDKLRAELPGILAWAVEGCLAWQREGLSMPDKVQQATASYREEMDTFGLFLTDRCLQNATVSTTTEALYQAYCTWCRANGEYELSKNHFGMRLRDRGFTPTRLGNDRAWKGIALVPEPRSQDAILARLRDIQKREQENPGA